MNFFDATLKVFSHWQEYLKLFLLELGVSILLGVVSMLPLVGLLGVIILTYYLFFLMPVGVYSIMKDETLDMQKVLKDTYDACLHPGNAIGQIGKIFLIILLLVVFLSIFIFFIIFLIFGDIVGGVNQYMTNEWIFAHFNIMEYLLSMLVIIVVAIVFSIIIAKMQLTLYYKILSQLLGDENYTYLETHKSLFTYDFIWTLIPIISIFAPYSLTTRFIHLYNEEKQKEDTIL